MFRVAVKSLSNTLKSNYLETCKSSTFLYLNTYRDLQFLETELVGRILNLYNNLSFVEDFENNMCVYMTLYMQIVLCHIKGKDLFFFIFLIPCLAYDEH